MHRSYIYNVYNIKMMYYCSLEMANANYITVV